MTDLKAHQEAALKRQRWDDAAAAATLYMTTSAAPFFTRISSSSSSSGAAALMMQAPPPSLPPPTKLLSLSTAAADVASAIMPPVTVVLEGRSICHRIQLSRHGSYQSLAAALRRMFVDVEEGGEDQEGERKIDGLDLSNAVPGHIVAYEDMEDDLLLAGDLNWKDFVRVVKRIRIIPAKASRRKHCRRHKCD